MVGHTPLLQMRRSGLLPNQHAWVTDTGCPMDAWFGRNWHGDLNPYSQKLTPCIDLAETDVPEALDFRCLVGLMVHLRTTRGADRAKRLFAAIRSVGPAKLICANESDMWLFQKEEGGNGKRIRA